ncbi:MAG: radical SAM protein, partial [Candidatus Woesearchaeota archaeon]
MKNIMPEIFRQYALNTGLISRVLKNTRAGQTANLVRNHGMHDLSVLRQSLAGRVFPTVLALELTTYCPRRCAGCYLSEEERKDPKVIDPEKAEKIVQTAVSSGIRILIPYGGEPIQEKTIGILERLLRAHPNLTFYSCTNADYIACKTSELDRIIIRDNYSIALSIDGFRLTNDAIRGNRSFLNVLDAAEYLKSRKQFFGASVSVRPENFEEVTSRDFAQFLINKGFLYIMFSVFHGLRLEKAAETIERIGELREMPLFIYNGLFGYAGAQNTSQRFRELVVDKNGNVLAQRKARTPISGLDDGIGTVASNPEWQRKFSDDWALGKTG